MRLNSVFSQVNEQQINARQISDTAILDFAREAPIIVVEKVLSVGEKTGVLERTVSGVPRCSIRHQ